MTAGARVSPEELAAVRMPRVENRLNRIEAVLSLLTLLTRALSYVDDLGLTAEQNNPGLGLAGDLGAEALEALASLQEALPRPVLFIDAPGKVDA